MINESSRFVCPYSLLSSVCPAYLVGRAVWPIGSIPEHTPQLPRRAAEQGPSAFPFPSPAHQCQPELGGRSVQRLHTLFVARLSLFSLHIHMASQRVLQYVAGAKKKPTTVYLHCHVKPGASKVREGITALTDNTIELCVSAVPKDGESNKAVLAVLSEVSLSHSTQLPAVLCTSNHTHSESTARSPLIEGLVSGRKADT